jgi:hypothetical protein
MIEGMPPRRCARMREGDMEAPPWGVDRSLVETFVVFGQHVSKKNDYRNFLNRTEGS